RPDQGRHYHPRAQPLPAGHRVNRSDRSSGLAVGILCRLRSDSRRATPTHRGAGNRPSLPAPGRGSDRQRDSPGSGQAARIAGPRRAPGRVRERAEDVQRKGPPVELPERVRERSSANMEGAAGMRASVEEIRAWIVARISHLTAVTPAEVDVQAPLTSYG